MLAELQRQVALKFPCAEQRVFVCNEGAFTVDIHLGSDVFTVQYGATDGFGVSHLRPDDYLFMAHDHAEESLGGVLVRLDEMVASIRAVPSTRTDRGES